MSTDDRWHTLELPVLREVIRRVEDGDPNPRAARVADALGLSHDQVQEAGQALKDRGLLRTLDTSEGIDRFRQPSADAYLLID